MTKAKAQKRLARAKEDLQYLREAYVDALRNANLKRLDTVSVGGHNYFAEKIADLTTEMAEIKTRIAKLERIAL